VLVAARLNSKLLASFKQYGRAGRRDRVLQSMDLFQDLRSCRSRVADSASGDCLPDFAGDCIGIDRRADRIEGGHRVERGAGFDSRLGVGLGWLLAGGGRRVCMLGEAKALQQLGEQSTHAGGLHQLIEHVLVAGVRLVDAHYSQQFLGPAHGAVAVRCPHSLEIDADYDLGGERSCARLA
jgi:hypothetical protein